MAGDAEGRRAYLAALRMLGRRALSVQEVSQRLTRRGFDARAVGEAVAELRAEGALDDAAYARAYVHDRLLFHPVGRRALRAELQRRGVPEEAVEEALADLGLAREEELIRGLLARRRPAGEGANPGGEARRLRRWLFQRGFSGEAIRRSLGGRMTFDGDESQVDGAEDGAEG